MSWLVQPRNSSIRDIKARKLAHLLKPQNKKFDGWLRTYDKSMKSEMKMFSTYSLPFLCQHPYPFSRGFTLPTPKKTTFVLQSLQRIRGPFTMEWQHGLALLSLKNQLIHYSYISCIPFSLLNTHLAFSSTVFEKVWNNKQLLEKSQVNINILFPRAMQLCFSMHISEMGRSTNCKIDIEC